MGTVATMEMLASLGGKRTGTPANRRARDFLARAMGEALGPGCGIADEPFSATVCTHGAAAVRTAGGVHSALLLDYTGMGARSACGKLLVLGSGSLRAFRKQDVRGAVVVCRSSLLNHRVMQAERARTAGASGMVLVSEHPDLCMQGIGCPEHAAPFPLPVLSVSAATWQELHPCVGQTVELSWNPSRTTVQGANLVCDLDREATGRFLAVGAHFDSWGNGAQDNCSGAALLVSLAGRLRKAGLHRGVRCLFFDGEELGMLGSRWHVSRHDPDSYRAYINLEMPVPTSGRRLRTFFFSRRLPLGAVPFALLLRHGYLPIPLELFYRAGNPAFPADVDPFHRAGVPAATTFCAGTHTHTEGDTCERVRADCFQAIEDALFRLVERLQKNAGS